MDNSLLDETDLAVLGAAIITAALTSTRVSGVDTAIDTFKKIATAIEKWMEEDSE